MSQVYKLQLAMPGEDHQRYIASDRWIAQPKYDGKRILLELANDRVTAQNRLEKSCDFPLALSGVGELGVTDLVLDGELVGERFFVFDILRLQGEDTRELDQAQRLELLTLLFRGRPSVADGAIVLTETARTTVEKGRLYDRIKAERGEGVVFKTSNGMYVGRRTNDWVKAKFWASCTAVVTARNDTGERLQSNGLDVPYRPHLAGDTRSVQVSLIDAGRLVTVGDVSIPINRPVPAPGTLVEVRYLYAYPQPEVRLYQPVYEGVRDDVTAEACQLSQLKWKQGLALAS